MREMLYKGKKDRLKAMPSHHPEWEDFTIEEHARIMELFEDMPLVDDYDYSILENGLVAYQNMVINRKKMESIVMEDDQPMYDKYYNWWSAWEKKYKSMLYELLIPTTSRIQWIRKYNDVGEEDEKKTNKFQQFKREQQQAVAACKPKP